MDVAIPHTQGFEGLTADKLLAALGGDNELLLEIIELYLRDAPNMLQALRAAAASGEAETLARAAHGLKGSTANFGITPLYDVARDIEHRAFAGELTGIEQRLLALEPAARAFEQALMRMRTELAA